MASNPIRYSEIFLQRAVNRVNNVHEQQPKNINLLLLFNHVQGRISEKIIGLLEQERPDQNLINRYSYYQRKIAAKMLKLVKELPEIKQSSRLAPSESSSRAKRTKMPSSDTLDFL